VSALVSAAHEALTLVADERLRADVARVLDACHAAHRLGSAPSRRIERELLSGSVATLRSLGSVPGEVGTAVTILCQWLRHGQEHQRAGAVRCLAIAHVLHDRHMTVHERWTTRADEFDAACAEHERRLLTEVAP